VGSQAAGAAGLVGLLFVRLELAVDVVERHLRGSGWVRQVVAAEAVRVPLNQRNLSGGTSANLAAGKQPVWREGRPSDGSPWHGLATTPPNPAQRHGKAKAEQDEPEHNGPSRPGTTGGPNGRQVHPAFMHEQRFGRKWCLAYGQLCDDTGTTVGSAVGRLPQPAPEAGQERSTSPAAPATGGRRLAHRPIRDIRRRALHIGGYAFRYTYSEREKRWKVFVRLDREN
jgi:hypothetical protein